MATGLVTHCVLFGVSLARHSTSLRGRLVWGQPEVGELLWGPSHRRTSPNPWSWAKKKPALESASSEKEVRALTNPQPCIG
mmetsp:Transcript_137380/g.238958  ORF Transcript_137380/g.238958 Transcript_137380/m.238958 type:complete len:81 (+) Transcript_137380:186-428(+)